MSTKAKRHTHKYYKVEIGSSKVWACALGDCNHYMPKNLEKLVVGKLSYCWNCNKEMNLNATNMKDDKPICIDCKLNGINIDNLIDSDNDNKQTSLPLSPVSDDDFIQNLRARGLIK